MDRSCTQDVKEKHKRTSPKEGALHEGALKALLSFNSLVNFRILKGHVNANMYNFTDSLASTARIKRLMQRR